MESIEEIIERNYAAQLKRGKVTKKIDFYDWIIDIRDEVNELWNSYPKHNSTFDEKELADIILVCLSMYKNYNIDIVKTLEEKTLFNETRKD
jgi:NTP pyrophosphatase (non-canonical NTP hydrolase)